MSDKSYRVVLLGKVAEGFEIKAAEEKLTAIFEKNAKQIKALFKKPKPTVIRKNLTQATATQYKTALEKLGVLCEVEDEKNPIVRAQAPQQKVKPPKKKEKKAKQKTATQTTETPVKTEELAFIENEPTPQALVMGEGTLMVTDIQMSLGALILFLMKWLLASIPAFILLGLIGKGITLLFWGVLEQF